MQSPFPPQDAGASSLEGKEGLNQHKREHPEKLSPPKVEINTNLSFVHDLPAKNASDSLLNENIVVGTPSTYAPQVVSPPLLVSALEGIYRHEIGFADDKIVSPECKIVVPEAEEKIVVTEDNGDTHDNSGSRKENPKAWYLRTSRISLLVVILLLVLLAAILSTWAVIRKKHSSMFPSSKGIIKYPDAAGIAASQWTDLQGIKHYRVYFQDEKTVIQESAWDSDTRNWVISPITGEDMQIQNETALAATVGWPHANFTYTLVS
jgi:hypothetical protein